MGIKGCRQGVICVRLDVTDDRILASASNINTLRPGETYTHLDPW